MESVVLSLGSNLGDRLGNICKAVRLIKDLGEITSFSALYRTDPVIYSQQPEFLNCAIQIRTRLSPYELLLRTQLIETDIGRMKSDIPKGPRIIDIDISLYGEMELDDQELTLPHPGVMERDFVMRTLLDIDPNICIRGRALKGCISTALQSNPRRVLATHRRFIELGLVPLHWIQVSEALVWDCSAAVVEVRHIDWIHRIRADKQKEGAIICASVRTSEQALAALQAGADIIRDESGGDCATVCQDTPYICVNPSASMPFNFNSILEDPASASLFPTLVSPNSSLPHFDFIHLALN